MSTRLYVENYNLLTYFYIALFLKQKALEENFKKVSKALQVFYIDPADKSALEVKIHELNFDLQNLHDKYDTKYYLKWVERVQTVRQGVHSVIVNKLDIKFDWFTLETDMSNNNLRLYKAINLVIGKFIC